MRNMGLYYSMFFFLVFSYSGYAQDKNAKKLFKQNLIIADEYFQAENYKKAMMIFEDLFLMDSLNTEVNYKLGICKFNVLRKKTDLLPYFERSKNDYPESYYYEGRIYHLKMMFNTALDCYMKYKNNGKYLSIPEEFVSYEMEKAEYAKKMITHPADVEILNVGNNINTNYPEYVPLVSGDESVMYFTSRRPGSTGDKLDPNGEYFEDIYYVEKEDSVWSNAKQLGEPVNTATHDL